MPKKKSKVAWDEAASAAENARRVLPPMADRLFRRGRKALRADASVVELHDVRLEVKRFRYALEVFRPCYGPAWKQRISSLKSMQDDLGVINDCAVTARLLSRKPLAQLPERGKLVEFLEKRSARRKIVLLRRWSAFAAPGQLEGWRNYLTRHTVKKRKTTKKKTPRSAAK